MEYAPAFSAWWDKGAVCTQLQLFYLSLLYVMH